MTDPSGYSPRVAIITGSARGLGFAIAQRLADDGIDIVINDLPSEIEQINEAVEVIKKKGRKAIGVPGDVTKEEDVKALVEKAVEALGSVDVGQDLRGSIYKAELRARGLFGSYLQHGMAISYLRF